MGFGKEYKLGDITEFTNGGAWSGDVYTHTGIPVVRVSDIRDGTIDLSDCKYLPETLLEKYKEQVLAEGDLIICTVGSHPTQPGSVVGRPGIVPKHIAGALLNQNAVRISPKVDFVDKKWLGYIGQSHEFRDYIIACARGAANQVRMSIGLLKEMPILVPPIPIQRRIADILSAYDDLIGNNTHRIRILEQMAQAIYYEWFGKVDNESLPKGWELDTLGNHISVDRGVSHKGEFMIGEGLPLLNLKSFSIGGGYRTDGLKSYSGEYQSKHVVHAGDIVLANTDLTQAGGIVGNPVIVPNIKGEILFTHHLYAIRFRSYTYLMKCYLYHLLSDDSYKSFAKGRAIGTTVLGLAQDGVLDFEFARPPKKLIEKFDEVVSPIYKLKDSLEAKNANLRQTRDLLLPRLVSGEIILL